jgi:mono/diheme cytochrome c family protein
MKHFVLGALLTLLFLVFGAVIYLRLGWAEVRADVPPSAWESSLMRMGVHAAVRRQAPEVANPIAPTDENLVAGGKIYLNECSGCHGTPGKPPKWADTLNPPAPRLAESGTEYSEAQIFWVAKHGIRRTGMFANGIWDSDQKLWTVSAYLYRIKNLPPVVTAEIDKAVNGVN